MNLPCPPLEQFRRLLAGQLYPAECANLDAHLESCPACQDRLDRLSARDGRVPEWWLREPTPGTSSEAEADFVQYLRQHPPPEVDDLLGQAVGPYTVVGLVGRGGFGTVYQATHGAGPDRQTVALKVLNPGLDNTAVLHRFRRERRVLAGLEGHPHIVTLCDGGLASDGRPYFVMEYFPGQPLDRFCNDKALTVAQRLRLFLQVCSAVQHAHQSLVIHRDLKPGNILAADGPDGQPTVKLLDFGIAKLLGPQAGEEGDALATRSGERMFTAAYASPEQIRGERVDMTSDVYSLGVLLYELLCGRRPYGFREATVEEVVCRHEPEPPSVRARRTEVVEEAGGETTELTPEVIGQRRSTRPRHLWRQLAGDLDNICLRALEKEPRRRYPSVEALARDVRRYLAGEPVAVRGSLVGSRKTIVLKPDDARSQHHLGLRLRARNEHAKAEAAYRQAIALNPDYAVGYNGLGLCLQAQDRHEDAEAAYRKAIALKPDYALAYCNLGNSLVLQGRYAQAEAAYHQAVALEPDFPEAYYNLGKTLALQDRSTEAEAAYRRAIELRPDYARAYFHLGNLLLRRGDHAGALTAFRHSDAIGSTQPGWRYPSAERIEECERLVGQETRGEGDSGATRGEN
jgi:serine/threonine protein kinase/lipoprotein NlpI